MGYFDISRALSYNRLLNMIVGGRSIGKTFNSKLWHLRRNLKGDNQNMLYIKRYKEDLNPAHFKYLNFFSDKMLEVLGCEVTNVETKAKYRAVTFTYKGKEHMLRMTFKNVLLDGREIVFYRALSDAERLKGGEYDDTNTILFDEFILKPNTHRRYLDDEVTVLLDVAVSIFRDRVNCKIILLANALNFNNPYFARLGIKPTDKEFIKPAKNVLIQFPKETVDEIVEDESSTVYSLLGFSNVANSTLKNDFDVGEHPNIGKKREGYPILNLSVNSHLYTCFSIKDGYYFKPAKQKDIPVYQLSDSSINSANIKSNEFFKKLKNYYLAGLVFYHDLETYTDVLRLFSRLT